MSERKAERKASTSSISSMPGVSTRGRHDRGPSVPGKRPTSVLAQASDVSQISIEEWEILLAGEQYQCQTTGGANDTQKDVILNVNITGIKVLDAIDKNILSEFDIEQILQYSYSQQNSTFSFSYLEEGRFFVTHKFQTPQFLDIHQYLGNAIAIVIKIKTQLKGSSPADLTQMIETAINEKKDLRIKTSPDKKGPRRDEEEEEEGETPSDERPSSAGERLSSIFAPPSSDPEISQGTYRKSSQAKNYFEDRYKKNPDGTDKIKDGRRTFRASFEEAKKLGEEDKLGNLPSPDQLKRTDSNMSSVSPTSSSSSKKQSYRTLTGSMRVKALTDMMDIFATGRRKKGSVDLDRMRNTSFADFTEYNPEQLPETITKYDENKTPVLIKTMTEGKYQITAGTVDALIEALADHQQPDSLYIDVFLQTYRNFLTPLDLLVKLRKRFNTEKMRVTKEEEAHKIKDPNHVVETLELDNDTMNLVRVRMSSVIKKWVERHWYDFEIPEVRAELNEALNDMKSRGAESVYNQIVATIKKHEEDVLKAVPFPVIKNEPTPNFDFSSIPPKEVAQAMTVVAVEYLKAIPPDEFVFFLWGKKLDSRVRMTRNLQRLIDRFNKVGMWVSTEICACTDLKKRTMVLEKFILIAKQLFKLQNFNDLIAVLFGLNSIPVYRLKKTWAGVPQKSIGIFKELEDKMKADGNYKQYRAIEYQASPPYIPFFGLYMKDLTFMNDGNQTYLQNQMVNVEKHRSIMSAIMSIRSSQQSDYKFVVEESLRKYCEIMYSKEEEELTEQSMILEPSLKHRRPSIASVGSEMSEQTEDTASIQENPSDVTI